MLSSTSKYAVKNVFEHLPLYMIDRARNSLLTRHRWACPSLQICPSSTNARISVRSSASKNGAPLELAPTSGSSLLEHEWGRKKLPTVPKNADRHYPSAAPWYGSARLVLPRRLLQRPHFFSDATPSLHTRGSHCAVYTVS